MFSTQGFPHFKNYNFWRICSQSRPNLGADAIVSAPKCGRLWEQKRTRLLPRSSTNIGKELLSKLIVVFFRKTLLKYAE